MDKNDIIEYVMTTPHNTNKAVLSSMLNQLTEGGSGGSSDFSTAQVTIPNTGGTYILGLPWIDPDDNYIVGGLGSSFGVEGPFTVPLYKGRIDAYLLGGDYTGVAVTGSAVYDSDAGFIKITGDCTITFS